MKSESKDWKINKSTPFWDPDRPEQERIDWLLSHMTIEEKLSSLASQGCDLPRLGIPGYSLGGEAAHGVQGRNDQGMIGPPDVTTSLPQPNGMCATWDPELLEQAGEMVGTEARVVSHRNHRRGLSRWAPTVDLERDPRWGRTEEGYGEDPLLIGEMASAYIRGLQGNDGYYVRCAATLKHFYGNNVEYGRAWQNSTIDPRNRYELYLEPFRRCMEKGGALGVMTAYNKVNGVLGILNPEVQTILKDRWGLMHAVGDGGALKLVQEANHAYGLLSQALAQALKAGVDAISDPPDLVREAAMEAWNFHLLTEADLDRALGNTFRVKLRLGVYDRKVCNPYDRVTEADILTDRARQIATQVSREAVVLLKNEHHFLPWSLEEALQEDEMAVIGPLADAWLPDWYGGCCPEKKTVVQGIRELTGKEPVFDNAYDRVRLCLEMPGGYTSQEGLRVGDDGIVRISKDPDIFEIEPWNDAEWMFRCVRTGKVLGVRSQDGRMVIAADREDTLDWHALEVFSVQNHHSDVIQLMTNYEQKMIAPDSDGVLCAGADHAERLVLDYESDGVNRVYTLAKAKKRILLCLGTNPMVGGREEVDRETLRLPPYQQDLLELVLSANPQTAVVLITNYPTTMNEEDRRAPAILLTASGGQAQGRVLAETVFGLNPPAGRLNMTWPKQEDDLPFEEDYDVIRGHRTYRYFAGPVMYPFGHGLTYTDFAYRDLKVTLDGPDHLSVSVRVTNTGDTCSDEVVQIYGTPPVTRVPRPLCQLLAFSREKHFLPGETRELSFRIALEEMRYYDVISEDFRVDAGVYTIHAGRSSRDLLLSQAITVEGTLPGTRQMNRRVLADHYDDCEDVELLEGAFGMTAVSVKRDNRPAIVRYRDCDLTGSFHAIRFLMKSSKDCEIEIWIDGRKKAVWKGSTAERIGPGDMHDVERPCKWDAVWMYMDAPLKNVKPNPRGCVELRIIGDIRLLSWQLI